MAPSSPLLEFKAGRIFFNSVSGTATPLPGKGRVTFTRSSEDPELLSFRWFPRGMNTMDNPSREFVIVPGDVTFSKVPECNTGRVIQALFASGGERCLYWLQELPEGDLNQFSESDERILHKANELVNTFGLQEEEEEEENNDVKMKDE